MYAYKYSQIAGGHVKTTGKFAAILFVMVPQNVMKQTRQTERVWVS